MPWSTFLTQYSENPIPETFLTADLLLPLPNLGLIEVSGAEALSFLQGQFTNDVRQVTETRSQLSAWCNSKGRVLFTFRLFKRDGNYYLLLPQIQVAALLKRLSLYKLRSAVNLAALELPQFGFSGPHSAQGLENGWGCAPPAEIHDSLTVAGITVLKVAAHRYWVGSSSVEVLSKLWSDLANLAQVVSAKAWELLDIAARLPTVLPEVSEEFVPQMLNYEQLPGVSFTKGCYSGQEVVARTQHLGTPKRRLYLATVSIARLFKVGEDLYNIQQEAVGKVVNVQSDPRGGCLMLAVLPVSEVGNETLRTQEGAVLSIIEAVS